MKITKIVVLLMLLIMYGLAWSGFDDGVAAHKQGDYATAVKWYLKAADQGHVDAQFNLGNMYDLGKGVTKNPSEALKWYRKAADQGHSDAQFNVGVAYDLGEGVTKNPSEALKWYHKAAEQGDMDAQVNLGNMYYKGQGTIKNLSEAAKWYRKAADQGHAIAQSNLGYRYFMGEGVALDYGEALKWYRKAADQGDVGAQINVGVMYQMGKGVALDYGEALKWYRKAAEQEYAVAQYNLANMYYEGLGVVKDLNKARKWIERATKSGGVNTKGMLEKINQAEVSALEGKEAPAKRKEITAAEIAAAMVQKESEFNSAMDMGEQSDFVVAWDSFSDLNMGIGSIRYKLEAIYVIQQKETDQLNDFNLMMWDNVETTISKTYESAFFPAPVYSEPTTEKDEFEITSEFNARKAKVIELAKRKYANALATHEDIISEAKVGLEEAVNNKQSFFLDSMQYWLKYLLGENTRVVTYDADKKQFNLVIHSEGLKKYSVEARLGAPIDEAESIKLGLENGKLHVLYLLNDSTLEIQRVVLRTDNKSYLITDVSDNLGDFQFTLEAANAYRVKLAAAEEERKKKEIEEAQHKKLTVRAWEDDQDPVFTPVDVELNFAQRYVLTLKSTMLKASYCLTFISTMERLANFYGADPVTIKQIDKLFDNAYDAGCVVL